MSVHTNVRVCVRACVSVNAYMCVCTRACVRVCARAPSRVHVCARALLMQAITRIFYGARPGPGATPQPPLF
jgi:hypothetical protein